MLKRVLLYVHNHERDPYADTSALGAFSFLLEV